MLSVAPGHKKVAAILSTAILHNANLSLSDWWLKMIAWRLKKSHFVGNKAKVRISKLVLQEKKPHQILRKMNIFYPLIRTQARANQGVRNVRFSENLTCFVFLWHPFWDSPFSLITGDLEIRTLSSFITLLNYSGKLLTEVCYKQPFRKIFLF